MTFNPVSLLYLNPNLQAFNSVITVEDAQLLYSQGGTSNLFADESSIPRNFDEEVYISDHKSKMDISKLNQTIKQAMLNDGEQLESLENLGEYFPTIYRRADLISNNTFKFNLPGDPTFYTITESNLNTDDWVKLIKNGSETHYGRVTSKLNSQTFTLSNPWYAFSDNTPGTTYLIYGIKLYDSARLARIGYLKAVPSDPSYTVIDSGFNYELYKMLYPDARLMSRDAAYIDYVNRLKNNEVRIGKTVDIRFDDQVVTNFNALSVTQQLNLNFAPGNGRLVWNNVPIHYVTTDSNRNRLLPPNMNGFITERAIKDYINFFFNNQLTINNLSVTGEVTLESNVSLIGPTTSINNAIIATMAVNNTASFLGATNFDNTTTFNDVVTHYGKTLFNESATFSYPVTCCNTVTALGQFTLNNQGIFNSNVTFNKQVEFKDTATFSSNLIVNSNALFYGTVSHIGVETFSNLVAFGSNTTFNQNAPVLFQAPTTFSNVVAISSNLTVAQGELQVQKGDARLFKNLYVNSNAEVTGILTVNSNSVLKDISVNGSATINSNLTVQDRLTVHGSFGGSSITACNLSVPNGLITSLSNSSFNLSASNMTGITLSNTTISTTFISASNMSNVENVYSSNLFASSLVRSYSNVSTVADTQLLICTSNILASNIEASNINISSNLNVFYASICNLKVKRIDSEIQYNSNYESVSNLTEYQSSSNLFSQSSVIYDAAFSNIASSNAIIVDLTASNIYSSNITTDLLNVTKTIYTQNIYNSNSYLSNVDISNKLVVQNRAYIDETDMRILRTSNLTVESNLTVNGTVDVYDNVVVSSNLDVVGTVTGAGIVSTRIGISETISLHPVDVSYADYVVNNLCVNETARVIGKCRIGLPSTLNQTMLQVEGMIEATNLDVTSDAILKTDVQPMVDCTSKVRKIRTVKYRYRHKYQKRERVGVIAQNLLEALPEAVSTTYDYHIPLNMLAVLYKDILISKEDHDLNKGDTITLLMDYQNVPYKILQRIDDKTVRVLGYSFDKIKEVEIVKVSYKEIKTVDYHQICCLLVGAFNELDERVTQLDSLLRNCHSLKAE